jgi:hypothetical protein
VEANGRGPDVILEDTWPTQATLDLMPKSQLEPAEIDRARNRAGDRVDTARDANPDRLDVNESRACLSKRAPDDPSDDFRGAIARSDPQWDDVAGKNLPLSIDDKGRDLRPADVDPNDEWPGTMRRGSGLRAGGDPCK